MYVCVGMRSCARIYRNARTRGASRTHHIEQGNVDHGQDGIQIKLTGQRERGRDRERKRKCPASSMLQFESIQWGTGPEERTGICNDGAYSHTCKRVHVCI